MFHYDKILLRMKAFLIWLNNLCILHSEDRTRNLLPDVSVTFWIQCTYAIDNGNGCMIGLEDSMVFLWKYNYCFWL